MTQRFSTGLTAAATKEFAVRKNRDRTHERLWRQFAQPQRQVASDNEVAVQPNSLLSAETQFENGFYRGALPIAPVANARVAAADKAVL